MKRYFVRKVIAGGLAALLLFGSAVFNLQSQAPALFAALRDLPSDGALQAPELIDTTISEGLAFREYATDLYGFAAHEMRKSELSDFALVVDEQGFLHHLDLSVHPIDTDGFAMQTAGMADRLAVQQIPLSFIITPDRYLRDFTELPEGIFEPRANQTADDLLAGLAEYDVSSIDLRPLLTAEESEAPALEEVFYHSDESWTNEAAFWAYTLIAEDLSHNPRSNLSATDLRQTGFDAFEQQLHEGSFAGNFTQTAGRNYVPLEDYTWLYPATSAQLSYTVTDGIAEARASGSFTEVLMPAGALSTPANARLAAGDVGYLPGNEPVKYIVNDTRATGPRVLIIGDAANEPLVAYLSTVCQFVMLIDPAAYEGDIMRIATELDFDQVYISLAPTSIDEAHFPWLRSVRVG
jgi:hypothetical protein